MAAPLSFNLALANLHRRSARELGFDILCDLAAVETAILDKNFVGSHACHDHSREIETGYIALQ
jgi:hypothetical protein